MVGPAVLVLPGPVLSWAFKAAGTGELNTRSLVSAILVD